VIVMLFSCSRFAQVLGYGGPINIKSGEPVCNIASLRSVTDWISFGFTCMKLAYTTSVPC
jgi:hypothetical protein